jgi:hypothetical protein
MDRAYISGALFAVEVVILEFVALRLAHLA